MRCVELTRRSVLGVMCVAGLLIKSATAQETPKPSPAFDLMEKLYKPLCTEGDDLGWPMKVHVIVSAGDGPAGELKFSTSTREVFYAWAKKECADWVADTLSYVPCHGDVHFGNMGTYVSDVGTARLSVGLKDFDETVSMPFQTDLLQAMVTIRLVAAAGDFVLTDGQAERGARVMLSAYREVMSTGRSATDVLLPDAKLSPLMESKSETLRDAAEALQEEGKFKRIVKSKKGVVKEIFHPAMRAAGVSDAPYSRDELARALNDSAGLSPTLAKLAVYRTEEQWADAIEGAVIRTRLGSGGSQGMTKMFIYVKSSIRLPGGKTDAVFYLKEQAVSSAAQRVGYVPADELPGGRRVSGGAMALTDPEVDGSGWCEIRGKSFYVDLANPWDDEPAVSIRDEADLEWAARYVGTILGAAHTKAAGGVENAARIKARATQDLERQLLDRSARFVEHNRMAHRAFVADPRSVALSLAAERAIQAQVKP